MTTISNPIIPGFAPDPSIVKIDGTFFLVTSSFHLFPGLPIYASTDLASWTHVGNAINRTSQLSLAKSTVLVHRDREQPLVGAGGLYAPTIRHHQGTTYIVCTNVIHSEGQPQNGKPPTFHNFIVSTTDIVAGKWSDPVFFDFNGIDPDLFFDDDGRVYVLGSSWKIPSGSISGFEIDVSTGAKKSEEQVVWYGAIKVIPEGPHLYKRGGQYYLLIAEGGTHDDHQISIARADSPLGPYESCKVNPILKPTAGMDTDVVYTGHGDLFQDAQHRWWLTCLGVRKTKDGRPSIMGRESFLTAAIWEDGSWPVLEQPIAKTVTLPSLLSSRDITSEPGVDWVYIRDPNLDSYKILPEKQTVSLKLSEAGLDNGGDSPVTFAGKRQRSLDGEARVTLSLRHSERTPGLAGLAYYKDEHRHATIAFDSAQAAFVFRVVNAAKSEQMLPRSRTFPVVGNLDMDADADFRIAHSEKSLVFSYRLRTAGRGEWTVAGTVDTDALTDQDFTGPCIGVFATCAESSEEQGWKEFSDVSLV